MSKNMFFRKASPSQLLAGYEEVVKAFNDYFVPEPKSWELKDVANRCHEAWNGYIAILIKGLFKWRVHLGSPLIELGQATTLAKTIATVFEQGIKRHGRLLREESYFQFGTAALLSGLVKQKFDDSLLAVLPQLDYWKSMSTPIMRDFYDMGLIQFIQNKQRPDGLEQLFEEMGPGILQDTYACYCEIIQACQSEHWPEALQSVTEAERLFDRRKKDTHGKVFSTWEGGGNEGSVDARLAVLLKMCFVRAPKEMAKIGSMHKWEW